MTNRYAFPFLPIMMLMVIAPVAGYALVIVLPYVIMGAALLAALIVLGAWAMK